MKKLYSILFALIALTSGSASATDYMTLEGMCANYRWEAFDADGSDIKFNVSIKQGAGDNAVVINGIFDKYELKGTFDPSTGGISIENQRVGFDAGKGQFLSFVHLTYDGDITSDPLLLDNSNDGDLSTFEEYGVVAETMDSEYLLADGLIDYGYMAFIFRTGEIVDDSWEDAGTATLFDGGFFTPLPRFGIGFKAPVEVVLEKSTKTENLYRLVKPWDSYFGKELNSYLEFDISDPANVIIPTQSTGYEDSEYGLASVQNFVGMYIAGGFSVEDAMAAVPAGREGEHICTYNDKTKVITMPVNAAFTTFAGDSEGYWNVGKANGAADSYIVMPGGTTTGVSDIMSSEDVPAEYYNLQGIRTDNPAAGVYIRRQGSKVTKVYVR